jgi:hypothetical protein
VRRIAAATGGSSSASQGVDMGQVMRSMKEMLSTHRSKLHALQKAQLTRDIERHLGGGGSAGTGASS